MLLPGRRGGRGALSWTPVNPEPVQSPDEQPLRTKAAGAPASNPSTNAEVGAYGACLLAMGRAVQNVGIYGTAHPASVQTVNQWYDGLALLIRTRGSLTLDSNGHIAVINGIPVPLALKNALALSLLRKLYTTRAGRIEFLAGFDVGSAMLLAEFLANADATRVAAESKSLAVWMARVQLHYLRVSPLRLREVREGDVLVSGGLNTRGRVPEGRPSGERPTQEQFDQWAEELQRETDAGGQPVAVRRKTIGMLVSFLRGTLEAPPAGIAEQVARAAEDPGLLADLILKSALVQQELSQRYDEPVGDDVVGCLRSVLNALQEMPESRTDEGWRKVIQTLTEIEMRLLERLPVLADGTEEDAQVIRDGIRAMHHDVEGEALKREYERKRNALMEVERRIRIFFGLDSAESAEKPEASAVTGG